MSQNLSLAKAGMYLWGDGIIVSRSSGNVNVYQDLRRKMGNTLQKGPELLGFHEAVRSQNLEAINNQ